MIQIALRQTSTVEIETRSQAAISMNHHRADDATMQVRDACVTTVCDNAQQTLFLSKPFPALISHNFNFAEEYYKHHNHIRKICA